MVALPAQTSTKPEARVFRVEDLLRHARAGKLRVPHFQRNFKWERDDVEKLIDSIWRGYPVGTLLLWNKRAPAGLVPLGQFTFEVNEEANAWFVVDGQQRIVSLVTTLLPDGVRPEKFDLYFDLVNDKVVHPTRGALPATHLPLNRVVDSEHLLEWVDEHRAALNPDLMKIAFRVGKHLREYEVPAYVVDVDDEALVREIYKRSNSTGKELDRDDIFRAILAPDAPTRLSDIVERLGQRSFGDIDEDQVLRSLLAIEGKDLAGDLHRQLDKVDLPAAVAKTEKALNRALAFLSQDAGIPHLRLLPYRAPLTVLAKYFDRFPTPSERARRLLTRWLWRGAATEELRGDGTGMRPAFDAIRDVPDAESSSAAVLATVAHQRPTMLPSEPFNLRYARSKIIAVALADMRPHQLQLHMPLNVASVLDGGSDAFPQIFGHKPAGLSADDFTLYTSVGNRLLHPATAGLSLSAALQTNLPSATLTSHGITAEAMALLRRGDRTGFLAVRKRHIEDSASRMVDARAEWDHSDRTSISSMSDEED